MVKWTPRFFFLIILAFVSASLAQDAYDDDAFEESEEAVRERLETGFLEAHELLNKGQVKVAFRKFKSLATTGHVQSQHMMGVCYLNGIGVGVSKKRAVYWFSRAAEGGYAYSMLVMGELCMSGEDVEKDFGKALAYLEPLTKAVWSFSVPLEDFALERSVRSRASYLAGVLLVEGMGVEKDLVWGVSLLIQASRTGDASASMFLAMAYAKGEIVERSFEESKRLFGLSDLQSFDSVRRKLEASMMENADTVVREEFEKAAKVLSASFTENLFRSQTSFAQTILKKDNEAWDPVFARALLKMAAESGYSEAEYLYGRLLILGMGGDVDAVAGREWLEKASAQGWVMADFTLGVVLLKGLGGPSDLERGTSLLDRAAEFGFYSAQLTLDGEMEAEFVEDEDDLRLCREKVKTDVRAAYALEQRLARGWLVNWEAPSKKRLKIFETGAKAGYARAEHAYAEFFYWSTPAEQDYAIAREYFQRACDQGHAQSYFKIGYIYEKGLSVEPDFVKAAEYYRKSCDFGDSWAANNLGAIYYDGELGERDFAKAMEYYQLAVERGNSVACYNIADMYRFGKGVNKDMPAAVEWYGKAAERGDVKAAQMILKLKKSREISLEDSEYAYWMEKAAELGDGGAMYELADMYHLGRGVPESQFKAAFWVSNYLKSLRSGQSGEWGVLLLAKILREEDWAGHDLKDSMRLCKQLEKSSVSTIQLESQILLAKIHLEDESSDTRPSKGFKLLEKVYKKASGDSLRKAQAAESSYRLSRCYAKGLGVKRDEVKRALWMKRSADLGAFSARYFYATYLIDGIGVKRNVDEGVKQLTELARSGYRRAWFRLASLLTNEDLKEVPVLSATRDEVVAKLLKWAEKDEEKAGECLEKLGVNYRKADPAAPPLEEEERTPAKDDVWRPAVLG